MGVVALIGLSSYGRAAGGSIVGVILSKLHGGTRPSFCTNLGDEDNAFCMPANLSLAGAPPFSDYEMSVIYMYFLSNLNVRGYGGVLASPDKETPGGSYYFHWERDAALVIRTMIVTRKAYPQHYDLQMTNIKAYVKWVDKIQAKQTPNGIDIRGEPKFELPNGEVFDGAWCRPQNDGPGLKAITLMEIINMLLEEGLNETADSMIRKHLWTNNFSKHMGGTVQHNLNYVLTHWAQYTCDLWEEVVSNDFFWNRLTMKKAMLMGIRFAQSLGAEKEMNDYKRAKSLIDRAGWDSHFNSTWKGSDHYVQEEHSIRPCDGAVILAFNHAWDDEEGQFPPHGFAVAKTVLEYNRIFTREYNQNYKDTKNGVGGIMYGRYPRDTYAGGNPWILTTAALAHLLYRAGAAIKENGLPDDHAMETWRQALHFELSDDKEVMALKFVTAGDAVLLRIRRHIEGDNFHMYEQISGNYGIQVGARDLTWSYAEVIWAMHARNEFFNVTDKKSRQREEEDHSRHNPQPCWVGQQSVC